MDLSNLIALLSGVALFLFGMTLMGDGLKKVAGNKLELVLYKLSSSPMKGVLLGTGVTAIIQSSSATSVMVVGFVNSGMMKVRQAIGIVLGAILGTSITGWIICLSDLQGGSGWVSLLSTSTLTGVVAVVGILLRMFSRSQGKQHVGDILLGFAVLMFGMQTMSASVSPLRESQAFLDLLTTFSNPLLGILVGMVFTCVLQSASAAVRILQALAYRVEPLEEVIDALCDEMKLHHVDRLQQGICTLHQGFVFNDLLTNFERVSDHCSNLAVATIELESDSFDPHQYMISLKAARSHGFDQYYEEYRRKFSLPEG